MSDIAAAGIQANQPKKVLGMRLTPLTRRRLHSFRANRRGYWSFWIFMVLFVVTLFAEVIANDKPLIVQYNGDYYFPVITSYPCRGSERRLRSTDRAAPGRPGELHGGGSGGLVLGSPGNRHRLGQGAGGSRLSFQRARGAKARPPLPGEFTRFGRGRPAYT